MRYPPTRVEDIRDHLFGHTVHDPYRWLEAEESEEVRQWMAAQDQLARAELAKLPGREALRARLRQLYYYDAVSAPLHRGARYFYMRKHADTEKAILYAREGSTVETRERVLIDPNTLGSDGSTALRFWVPSYDGESLAYGLSQNNADETTLFVLDVPSGRVSSIDVIEGAKYAQPSWTKEGDGFYYTFLPRHPNVSVADRPGLAEVRFHQLGTPARADRLVHPNTGDPATFIGAELSRDGRFLLTFIQHGWNSTDVYFRDLRREQPGWRPLAVGIPALFNVTAWRDQFYIHTNDGASSWRIFRADAESPARAEWREIVPEREDAVLERFTIVGGQLALLYLHRAASQLELCALDGGERRRLSLPAIGTSSGLIGNPDEDEAYYDFSSFTRLTEIYRISVGDGSESRWAEVQLPINAAAYAVQIGYRSKDGTAISMFLVHRRNLLKDGSTPFILTGYGGFSVSMTPAFNSGFYPWLEAGGGFAIPNLRGGGEYGEAWHQAGMGAKKQNVFDDFIAAAEYLVQQGYTRPERLVIRGGSNGGLLVGAALTQRPDLFRAVICAVPLLDMVRYHLFGSGKTWIPEYGSAENEAELKTLLGYSPYHHVKPGVTYPALLMMSADGDDRVDPMHARKMTAALQHAAGGPALLRIEQHAGHGGADLVKQAVEQQVDAYAFLMSQVDMTPVPPPSRT